MQLFANNASSTLASAVNAIDNTLVLASGEGARFPAPTGGDYFLLTLTQGVGLESSWEIVKCTSRVADTLTVVRAQEGTTGLVWPVGSKADLRITKGTLDAALLPLVHVTTTTHTATPGTHCSLENAAATTVTLPASPIDGDVVWVTVNNGRTDNVLSRNSTQIMGVAEDMTLDVAMTYQLRFIGTSWRLL